MEKARRLWPAVTSLLVVGVVYSVLADDLRIAPAYMLLVLMGIMLIPGVYAQVRRQYRLSHLVGLGLVSVATLAVGSSVALFVTHLPVRVTPEILLRDAGLIWVANVATFAVWYWEIDGGGPMKRPTSSHQSTDFLFPQDQTNSSPWAPSFTDYLFLAFNQSTAFGPTDTAVMSKQAKMLSMLQATFSLLIIAVVVARATAQ